MDSENKNSTDTLPDKNENYKDVQYWDQRYMTEESYEWCKDFRAIKSHIEKHIKQTDKILVIGCGNSNLSIDLYNAGYQNITNIDYSSVVIEKLSSKYGHLMKYRKMDMREMTFDDNDNEKFDVVIEKSTLDVLFTSEASPWTLSDEAARDAHKTLTCIKNVLRPNHDHDDESGLLPRRSKFISITFAEPYFRKKLYSQHWERISVESFGDFFHYYFYVMQ